MRGGLPNFYNMLQTGVVDAAMLWPEAAITFKINEVAPHLLKADLGPVNSKTVTVNKQVWEKLPDEVKDALKKVQIAWSNSLADRSPAIAEFFTSFALTADDVSGLAYEISAKDRDPADVAADWVAANSDRVDAMLGL